MPIDYTVKEGDHLLSIAKEHGYSDYTIIWDHPNNAELKEKRKNPNVLFPSDVLFIPDRELREESKGTEQKHLFELKRPELKLRLILEDMYERPIANAACELVVEGKSRQVTTTGEGKIDEKIPPQAKTAVLLIRDPQTPAENVKVTIKIGHLDPVDELPGQKARLNNLGYFAGAAGGPADDQFLSAVEEFQCDHHLHVDGVCGPKTQAKLKVVHGC